MTDRNKYDEHEFHLIRRERRHYHLISSQLITVISITVKVLLRVETFKWFTPASEYSCM